MEQATHSEAVIGRGSQCSVGLREDEGLRHQDNELPTEQSNAAVSVAQNSSHGEKNRTWSDAEIVEGIKSGDQAICDFAYRQYHDLICRAIRSVRPGITQDEMEDAKQTAWLYFMARSLQSYDPRHRLSTYIYNVTRWSLCEKLTKGKGDRENLVSVGGYETEEGNVEASPFDSITNWLPSGTEWVDVEQRLRGINPRALQIFKMIVIEGYTETEAGEQLGVSKKRAQQLFKVARNTLSRKDKRGKSITSSGTSRSPITPRVRKHEHCTGVRDGHKNSKGVHEPDVPEARDSRRSEAREAGGIAVQEGTVLTPKQHHLVNLVAQGLTNADIAGRVKRTEQGMKNHLREIFNKVGCSNRVELALWHVKREHERGVHEPIMFDLVRRAADWSAEQSLTA